LFTGIVEDLGEVEAVEHLGDFARIHVRSAVVTQDARPGDSICVNGVCLTVTGLITSRPAPGAPATASPAADSTGAPEPPSTPIGFTADVMGETLRHSSLKSVSPGTKVNLERSVRLADRLGGHLVQGHTDGTATIVSRDPQFSSGGATPRTPRGPSDGGAIVSDGLDWDVVRIGLPASLARYVVHKGSITVDGVSLTVSGIADDWFEVSLIPETLKRTTLGVKQPGAEVNLEVDVIAKYTEKLLGGAR
jgi:riboflavin synthase